MSEPDLLSLVKDLSVSLDDDLITLRQQVRDQRQGAEDRENQAAAARKEVRRLLAQIDAMESFLASAKLAVDLGERLKAADEGEKGAIVAQLEQAINGCRQYHEAHGKTAPDVWEK